jgi:hypothetical protein
VRWRSLIAGIIVLACLTARDSSARGSNRDYGLGAEGWNLEQFGSSVMVLRTRQPSGSSSGGVSLFLSCSGENRQLRLTFPEPFPNLPDHLRSGYALVRAQLSDGGVESTASGYFILPDTRTLVFADGPGRTSTVVPRVIGMLRARSRQIDIVAGFGASPQPVGRLFAYHLLPVFGPGHDAMFGHVATSCAMRTNLGNGSQLRSS